MYDLIKIMGLQSNTNNK